MEEKRAPGPLPYISLQILIFALLVLVTAFLFRPLQIAILDRMEALRGDLLEKAETFTGLDISYNSMGPSIFGTLDFRGINISRKGKSLLAAPRLRVTWSLRALLDSREQNTLAVKVIRLDSPSVTLDDEDLQSLLPSGGSKPERGNIDFDNISLSRYLAENFLFRIRNGEYSGKVKENSYGVKGLNLDLTFREGRLRAAGRWETWLTFANGLSEGHGLPETLKVTGKLKAWVDEHIKNGEASLSIPRCSSDNFTLNPLELTINLEGDSFSLSLAGEAEALNFKAHWDYAAEDLSLLLQMNNFSPRNLLSLKGQWKAYDPWLAFTFSGSAALEKTGAEPLLYTLDLGAVFPAAPPGKISSPVPLEGASFLFAGQGTPEHIDIWNMAFHSSGGSVTFKGAAGLKPFLPGGNLVFANLPLRNIKTGGTQRVNGRISFFTREKELTLSGDGLSVGTVQFSNLEAYLQMKTNGLSFTSSVSLTGDDRGPESPPGLVSLEGVMDYDPRHIEANISLETVRAGDFFDIIQPLTGAEPPGEALMGAIDGISVSTELFVNTDFEHILYNATSLTVAYQGKTDISFSAAFSGTERRIDLSEGRVRWPGGEADVSGNADFSNFEDISFFLAAASKDMTYYFEGMVLDRRSLSLHGSYGLEFYASSGGDGAYSGYGKVENLPIPVKEQYALLSFSSSLRYVSPSQWSVSLERLEIDGLVTPFSNLSELRLQGSGDQEGFSFGEIYFEDGRGALEGTAGFAWDEGYQHPRFTLHVQTEDGKETYDIEGDYGDNNLNVSITGENMQFARFSRKIPTGHASGNVHLSGNSLDSFRAELNIETLSIQYQESEMTASVMASLTEKDFSLRNMEIHYQNLTATVPFLYADCREAKVETQAWVEGDIEGKNVYLNFSGKGDFNPIANWLEIEKGFASFQGSLDIQNAWYDEVANEYPFTFQFSRRDTPEGKLFSLEGGPSNMIRLKYFDGGDFYLALSTPSPIRGSVLGSINAKTVDIETSGLYVDLASLWRFIPPQDYLSLSGGFATVSLHITGPLNDPDFNGRVQASGVRINVPDYLGAEALPAPFVTTIEDSEMRFGPVDCRIGKGSGTISASFRFDQWIPSIFNLDIQVPLEHSIPVAMNIKGIVVNGSAGGNIKLGMEDLVFSVNGVITAHDTVINLDADEIAANRERDSSASGSRVTSSVDMTIQTGKKVEFLWPMTEFPILQAYADMGSSLRITANTLDRTFTLKGDVAIRSGEIYYFERSFYIREGNLLFNENEEEFDPRISARAEIRDRSDDGPVTISIIIDNSHLSSFTARFESTPPLSQAQIFNILGQNAAGSAGDDGTRNNYLSAATDALTQFGVVRRGQRWMRDFLHLDMFSIRTQILQNMAFQASGLQKQVESNTQVGNYFDNTAVFFGKYLGTNIFLQSIISFRYNAENKDWGGVSLEPEIGLEMRNPLFDVRFNLIPSHPENWFMNDVSFTLTWRRSF